MRYMCALSLQMPSTTTVHAYTWAYVHVHMTEGFRWGKFCWPPVTRFGPEATRCRMLSVEKGGWRIATRDEIRGYFPVWRLTVGNCSPNTGINDFLSLHFLSLIDIYIDVSSMWRKKEKFHLACGVVGADSTT